MVMILFIMNHDSGAAQFLNDQDYFCGSILFSGLHHDATRLDFQNALAQRRCG
jgi:hypothetical protein